MPVPARAARAALTVHFVVYGIVLAVWVTRIPAIRAQAGLTDGALGAALLAIPAGVLLVTLLAGWLADLRDNLHTSAGFAAAGFAAFSLAMAIVRLLGDRLAARLGPVRLVRASGLLAGAGLAAGLLSGTPAGGVAGSAVLGAGLACIAPQVFLAGGQAGRDRPGGSLSMVVGVSYLAMVGGPPLIGLAAGVSGLPLALGIPVLLCGCVAVLAWVVGLPVAALGPKVSERPPRAGASPPA